MNTKEDIINGLKRLGVKSGDTLFLRISYKAIGETEGGPTTLLDAILEVIGPNGTIIAAAFPKRQSSRLSWHKAIFEPGKNMSTGLIPKLMSMHPDAYISTHPLSPFVCIGKNAKELTSYHTPEKNNMDLLIHAINISEPKCLRVGGAILTGTTHMAFTEGLIQNKQYHLRKPEGIYYYDETGKLKYRYQEMSFFCKSGFEKFCKRHIYTNPDAVVGKGLVGRGEATLTDMRTTLEIERKWIVPNPQILLCDNPECMHCRSAYSYSDYSLLQFVLQLIKMKLKGEYTRGHLWKDIKDNLILFFFGRKCR
jgi:aminoglycoside N3'-acetyltransferase